MDPNTTLAELREMVRLANSSHPAGYDRYTALRVADVLERVQALDEWITRGGYLPAAWR